jgi:hypothetical protein
MDGAVLHALERVGKRGGPRVGDAVAEQIQLPETRVGLERVGQGDAARVADVVVVQV